jgi:hypothetical protein
MKAIMRRAECPKEMAACFLPWLVQLGQFHGQLFYGIEAEPWRQEGLLLRLTKDAERDVYERWTAPVSKKRYAAAEAKWTSDST